MNSRHGGTVPPCLLIEVDMSKDKTKSLGSRSVRTMAKRGEFMDKVGSLQDMLRSAETEYKRLTEVKERAERNGITKLTPTLKRSIDDACKSLDLAILHCRVFCHELKVATKEEADG